MKAGQFVLWDRESGNVLGVYPTKQRAYSGVAAFVRTNGPGITDDLLLAHQDEDGIPTTIANGSRLVADALVAGGVPAATATISNESNSRRRRGARGEGR